MCTFVRCLHLACNACACDVLQARLVIVTPEELAYIMVYVQMFFLPGKSFAQPESKVYIDKLDDINDEIGPDASDHIEFAKKNWVIPMKVAMVPKVKATIRK